MSEQLTFPGMPEPVAPAPLVKVSADRARTARQRAGIAQMIHPLSWSLDRVLRIHPQADDQNRACRNCRFREVINPGSKRSYGKCVIDKGPCSPRMASIHYPRVTHGPGTDVRRWWPGCVDHEFGDNALSPDAARSGPPSAYAE